MTAASSTDRFATTNTIASKIGALRDEMRAAIPAVGDLQAKALLETGAEVLGGLQHAFIDYADGSEEAWQR